MTNHYCVDQQILDWHYRTVWRYQLGETPIKASKFTLLLSRFSSPNTYGTRALVSHFSNKGQKKDNEFKDNEFGLESLALFLNRKNSSVAKVYLNHIRLWSRLKKITLHITSGKLLSNIELYASFYMAFCCCGNQSPQMIKSKQAVAGFSIIKSAIIGTRSSLRNKNKLYFSYKWAFIMAELPFLTEGYSSKPLLKNKELESQCLGINNMFVFPELDKYNYYLFEPIPGFDLGFYYSNIIKKRRKSKNKK